MFRLLPISFAEEFRLNAGILIGLALCLIGLIGHAQQTVQLAPPGAALDRFTEYRFCGLPPKRDADGTISRSSAVLAAYRKFHPCPETGASTGACPGWALNHVYPLVNGGCDAVFNLQWLPTQIKSCALSTGVLCVDRFEEKIYASPPQIVRALKVP